MRGFDKIISIEVLIISFWGEFWIEWKYFRKGSLDVKVE